VSSRGRTNTEGNTKSQAGHLEDFLQRARELGRMGSADVEAILVNTVILEIDGKRVDAYIRRGICYEKRGRKYREQPLALPLVVPKPTTIGKAKPLRGSSGIAFQRRSRLALRLSLAPI
jgi:hypothetical protein